VKLCSCLEVCFLWLLKGPFEIGGIRDYSRHQIYACRSAYLTVLKMCKLLLTVIGHVMARVVDDPQPSPPQQNECGGPDGNGLGNLSLCSSSNTAMPTLNSLRSPVAVLRQALHSIPNQNTEYMLRSVASKLAQNLAEQVSRSVLNLSPIPQT
jgi:hypothetical protein